MKKLLLISAFLVSIFLTHSQVPQAFKYQAIVRNSSGNIIANQSVHLRISILEISGSTDTLYTETHQATTNQLGLVSLSVGGGSPVFGTFADVDWATGNKWIHIAVDAEGGNNFVSMGTSQLLAVPYALYAEQAGNATGGADGDTSSTNELQTLSIAGDTLSISNGNSVIIGDSDADPTNEIQDISLIGTSLSISSGSTVDLSVIQDGVDDADADPTNELQTLRLNSDTIFIDKGNYIVLPVGVVSTDDQVISISNDTIFLEDGGFVKLPENATAWQSNGNSIYYDNGNVGIGTTAPIAKLQVFGGIGSGANQKHAVFGIEAWATGSPQLGLYAVSNTSGAAYAIQCSRAALAADGPLVLNPTGGNVSIATIDPKAKLQVTGGDVYIEDINKGVIMKSPNGSCWRLTVSNAGAAVFTSITCP